MKELIKFGKKMVQEGLVHSHSGNVSKRIGDEMLISVTGSMLDELEEQITKVSIFQHADSDIKASKEIEIHREIYKRTPALSILHGHSPFAVTLSITENKDSVKPLDIESQYYLKEIPIIEGVPGSKELAVNAGNGLIEHVGIIIKGHGPVTRGGTVAEAYSLLCCIEHACKVRYLVDFKNRFQ